MRGHDLVDSETLNIRTKMVADQNNGLRSRENRHAQFVMKDAGTSSERNGLVNFIQPSPFCD